MWRKFLMLKRSYHLLNVIKNPAVKTGFFMLNTAHLLDIERNLEEKTIHFDNPYPLKDGDFLNYNCELRHVGEKNQEAMRNLIRTLNSCIEEICEQYQHCVVKQIEITLTCMALDPVGQHWDELTKYRVEADDLKNEFYKYSMLVERIGQIVESCGSGMESDEGSVEAIVSDYEQLKELIQQKIEENKYWDSRLLDVNTESILMSSQRGNDKRTRPQKYNNRTVFKNDMHDTSHRTKMINSLQICEVCVRCKDVIEWKIKYKKYKPLSQPKTCVKCSQKTVKKAYHVVCSPCAKSLKICAKCLESKELVPPVLDEREKLKLELEMKQMLQTLSERKRRAFLRYASKREKEDGDLKENASELAERLKKLVVDEGNGFGSDFSDLDDNSEDDNSLVDE